MKAILALAVLAVFATITGSSVVPPDNSDSSDIPTSEIVVFSEVIHSSSDGNSVIPYSLGADPYDVPSSPSGDVSGLLRLLKGRNSLDFPSLARASWLFEGSIGSNDRLIDVLHVNQPAIPNRPQQLNVEYRRVNNARISAIIADERVYWNQGASVRIIAGGVGQSFVRLQFTAKNGGTIYYFVEIHGP